MGLLGVKSRGGAPRWLLTALAAASLSACATARMEPSSLRAGGTMRPYQVNGMWYRPAAQPHYNKVGLASWYGQQYHNRITADGEVFDMNVVSGAHTTLPLPSIVEVTNLDNGRRARVRLNDRGPFVGGRIIDLSRQAAKDLGVYATGTARVRVRYIGPAPPAKPADEQRYARAAR